MSFTGIPKVSNVKVIKQKAFWIVPLAAALIFAYIQYWPAQFRFPCPIHSLTGFWCPGCGSTRAAQSVLRGDFQIAFQNNALLLMSPVFAAIALFISRYSQKRLVLYSYLALLALAIIIFTIMRNQSGSNLAPL